ncbi:MAG TPA: molybdopterin-dependent oxidoreductase, partial [Burkholderiaceae bacterium]|nr:molybdopterin-dependent oxidoreductase [Burkholderiaceae bacterium]
MTDTSTHHRICPLCEACCGLEIKVQGNAIISIRGHEADVLSHGYICPKAVSLKDLHEDPDRLRTPLIKRNGVHVPATWDEAFAEIEKRLLPIRAQHGKNSVGVTVGNPSAHKIGLLTYFGKLARALGTKNVFSASTLDQMPKQLASGLMFGHWLSIALPDIERTDLLIVLGANPLVSNGSMWTVPDFRGKAKALRARGGELIVIDPRRIELVDFAEMWLPLKPGTNV